MATSSMPVRKPLFTKTYILCRTYLVLVTRLVEHQLHDRPTRPTARQVLPHNTEPDASASSVQSEIKRLRDDLGRAQRSRGQLEVQLKDIEQELKDQMIHSEVDRVRTADLAKSLQHATIKLRDKDEELRGKAKLLEVSRTFCLSIKVGGCLMHDKDVHDENLSLTLQLNVMEDRNKELRLENQELIDRWMAKMGKEAEVMNEASQYS